MFWNNEELAQKIIDDISPGTVINVGIGAPTKILGNLPTNKEIVVHSENGILGISGLASSGNEDSDIIDAGKNYVTISAGASVFDSSTSFSMVRGGHVDLAILGAYQISSKGDIANWRLPGSAIAGIGGAADICAGVKEVWVMTRHQSAEGAKKLLSECTYPLTAQGVVTRVYTDIGIFYIEDGRFVLVDKPEGQTLASIRSAVDGPVSETQLAQ